MSFRDPTLEFFQPVALFLEKNFLIYSIYVTLTNWTLDFTFISVVLRWLMLDCENNVVFGISGVYLARTFN